MSHLAHFRAAVRQGQMRNVFGWIKRQIRSSAGRHFQHIASGALAQLLAQFANAQPLLLLAHALAVLLASQSRPALPPLFIAHLNGGRNIGICGRWLWFVSRKAATLASLLASDPSV